jgi:hypothetical protein
MNALTDALPASLPIVIETGTGFATPVKFTGAPAALSACHKINRTF